MILGEKTKSLLETLSFRKPEICQSDYQFQQPGEGIIQPYQDAMFHYVEPMTAVVNIKIALDNLDESNSCTWVAPGSHRHGLIDGIRYVRTMMEQSHEMRLKFRGAWPMKNVKQRFSFIPVRMNAGDAIVLHSLVLRQW